MLGFISELSVLFQLLYVSIFAYSALLNANSFDYRVLRYNVRPDILMPPVLFCFSLDCL